MRTTQQRSTPKAADVAAGLNIRRIRKARGMSQEVLAKAIGLTFQQVQKYERGSNRVSISMLMEICAFLQCSPLDILPTEYRVEFPAGTPWLSDATALYMRSPEMFEQLCRLDQRHLNAMLIMAKSINQPVAAAVQTAGLRSVA